MLACFFTTNELLRLHHLFLFKIILLMYILGFPGGSDSRESACNARELNSIPELGKSAGEGNGYPLQYSGLENYMDRGPWQAIVHGVAESDT